MSELPLRPIEFQVLVILADRTTHGYDIIRETERRTGGKVRLQPGTLYRAIQRLEDAGLIHQVEDPPERDSDDPRRRYFTLSDEGKVVAAAEAGRLAALVDEARAAGLFGAAS